MPRGTHVGLVRSKRDINLAVENVVRWHIQAVRTRKDGSITMVKHVRFGWMAIGTYYDLQKWHDLLPVIVSVIEGGYRLKAAIWSQEVTLQVLATGTSIPLGVVLITISLALFAVDTANGDTFNANLDFLALFLPFGELWLLYRGLGWFLQEGEVAAGDLKSALDSLTFGPWSYGVLSSNPLPPNTIGPGGTGGYDSSGNQIYYTPSPGSGCKAGFTMMSLTTIDNQGAAGSLTTVIFVCVLDNQVGAFAALGYVTVTGAVTSGTGSGGGPVHHQKGGTTLGV